MSTSSLSSPDQPKRPPAALVVALLAGVLAVLGAVAVPFLPVKERTAALTWPSRVVGNTNAPLLSYFPESFDLRVPCRVVADKAAAPGDTTIFSTIPASSSLATTRGLVVRVVGPEGARSLQVVLRGETLVTADAAKFADPGCQALVVRSTRSETAVEAHGAPAVSVHRTGANLRPQIVGFYTDLSGARDDQALAGLRANAVVDSRFLTEPTPLKLGVLVATSVLLLISLIALALGDRRGPSRRPIPWRLLLTPRPADAVVASALAVWHVIGANTPDDNYLATMARASKDGGYIANYYRYFGAPDDPVGWFYQIIKLMTETGVSSPWLRLPTLFVNLGTWIVLSRFVLPRLLRQTSKAAALIGGWSAALVFLCFVLAYDNGLRPESWIALGVLGTWALVEHGITARRLLPIGLAGITASATLTCGPTGAMVYFTAILAARPLLRLFKEKAARLMPGSGRGHVVFAYAAILAPIAAAFCSVSLIGFWRISYGAFRAATAAKIVVGPRLHWYEEIARYQGLMGFSPDGAFSRRFPMLIMLLVLVVVAGILWRAAITARLGRHARLDLRVGPTRRIVGLTFVGLLCLMLTPTKPTHHFGAFAGLGAAVVAAGAAAVLAIATARTRAVYAAALLFLIGLTYTAPNDWWYPAGYGAPFRTTAIRFGVSLGTVFYYLGGLALAVAFFLHLFGNGGRLGRVLLDRRFIASGILIGALLTLVVELGATSVQAATVSYSTGARSVSAVAGRGECGLADAVLVDTDPQKSILRPVSDSGSAADALLGEGARGFAITTPHDQNTESLLAQANLPDVGPTVDPLHPVPPADPADLIGFGLDPKATPLVISATGQSAGAAGAVPPLAELTSRWYRLPENPALITLAAVGYFPTSAVQLEFSPASGGDLHDDPSKNKAQGPSVAMIAADRAPGWRDLRLGDIPKNAKAVRVKVRLDLPGPSQWIALTPPRVPKLATLQQVVGRTDPVFADWEDGLGFPCMRPFGYRNGVIELPKYHISPDRVTDSAFRPWMDAFGGGPGGIVESVAHAVTMPTYLKGALGVDWGKAQRLIPREQGLPAEVTTETVTRSGLANPGPLGSGVAGSSWETDPSKLH
ncbi:arabinosyltransferase domain-containing protein [Segniliparus rugosus]|uniref:arabinosyltransferase domain-containing protein n=1 Tax=Segniliparus rugosus TaxID=286804 RepID=UPI0002E83BCA|nr:arabinosyltransferase domain-containing protein [Segniliparus rugosus]